MWVEIEDGWATQRVVHVYDAKDGWRWHRKIKRGGRVVAESGESYRRQSKCVEAAQRENPGLPVLLPKE